RDRGGATAQRRGADQRGGRDLGRVVAGEPREDRGIVEHGDRGAAHGGRRITGGAQRELAGAIAERAERRGAHLGVAIDGEHAELGGRRGGRERGADLGGGV